MQDTLERSDRRCGGELRVQRAERDNKTADHSGPQGPQPEPAPSRHSGLARSLLGLQRSAGNRAVGAVLQRQLAQRPTNVVADINLAASIPRGRPSGFTPPVVNDRVMPVPLGTAAAAADALRVPEVAVNPDPSGDSYAASVTRVPTNTVGAEIHYPTAPPWSDPAAEAVRIAAVAIGGEDPGKRFEGSATLSALDRVATTRFRARGEIGDARFQQQIQQHEQHHANDHWAAAQTVLGPWDAALTRAHDDGQRFPGASPEAARAALYEATGGTAAQLGTRLDTEWNRLDKAFHADPAGAPSDMSHYFVESDGSMVDAWYKYPY